jgi:hypothetical protein
VLLLTFACLRASLLSNNEKEADMFQNEENTTGIILISVLIGGIIGASAALLLAPQAGKKTRKQIIEVADDAREYASDYAKKLKQKVS